jgi:hypothetical protein
MGMWLLQPLQRGEQLGQFRLKIVREGREVGMRQFFEQSHGGLHGGFDFSHRNELAGRRDGVQGAALRQFGDRPHGRTGKAASICKAASARCSTLNSGTRYVAIFGLLLRCYRCAYDEYLRICRC